MNSNQQTKPTKERSLYHYIVKNNTISKDELEKLIITVDQAKALLRYSNKLIVNKLKRYFNLEGIKILDEDGMIPSAEPYSDGDEPIKELNKLLWSKRKYKKDS